MSTTIEQIITIGDDRRRDSTSGAIDASKKLRAVVDTLQQIHSAQHWDFTLKKKLFNYYGGETDYNTVDTVGLPDFKDVKSIRLQNSVGSDFTKITTQEFDHLINSGGGDSLYAIEYRLGDPVLRVSYVGGRPGALLGNTYDHDEDGTWAANTTTSDASNVSTNTNEGGDHAGAVQYDTLVSQSVNNYAELSVTTTSQADLTEYLNYGAAFMWWEIPALDAITGATLRWGSDSSNYYTVAVTTTSDNGALATGLNRLKFDWTEATTVGTPSVTAIDYLLFRTTYGAGQSSDQGFRFDGLKFTLPTKLELMYYSTYTAQTSAGVWKSEPTLTSDLLLIPDRYREVVIDGYVANLLRQAGKSDDALIYEQKYNQRLKDMTREFGVGVRSENRSMRPSIRWNS